MHDFDLRERLEGALDTDIIKIEPLSVGFGLTGAVVTTAGQRRFAVKAKAKGGTGGPSLALEGYMLEELGRGSDLPLPKVHVREADLLVMDFIDNDSGRINAPVQQDAARLIAALHGNPQPGFGYERDTLIGPLDQPNPASSAWIPFFREHRLLYMANAARDEGRLPAPLHGRLERLAESLEAYLLEPAFASLLHGDLWTGNLLVKDDRVAGFIDPAIYCGHREIELAFATLFGTFGPPFFEVYESIMPLEQGFHEVRRDIYNLYPVLVHVRLFGAGYLGAVEETLQKLGL